MSSLVTRSLSESFTNSASHLPSQRVIYQLSECIREFVNHSVSQSAWVIPSSHNLHLRPPHASQPDYQSTNHKNQPIHQPTSQNNTKISNELMTQTTERVICKKWVTQFPRSTTKASNLDGFIIHLPCFWICSVWLNPRLQQIFIERVTQCTNWRVLFEMESEFQ